MLRIFTVLISSLALALGSSACAPERGEAPTDASPSVETGTTDGGSPQADFTTHADGASLPIPGTCAHISECAAQCANETCIETCIETGSNSEQDEFVALRSCATNAGTGECATACAQGSASAACVGCVENLCEHELDTCVGPVQKGFGALCDAQTPCDPGMDCVYINGDGTRGHCSKQCTPYTSLALKICTGAPVDSLAVCILEDPSTEVSACGFMCENARLFDDGTRGTITYPCPTGLECNVPVSGEAKLCGPPIS